MDSVNIILKWQNYFWNNKYILKELKKYENLNLEETDFLDNCQIINKKIYAKYGAGLNKINTLTIRSFFYAFINCFDDLTNKDLVFIASDGTKLTRELLLDISYIKSDNVNFVTFDKFEGFDKKIVNETVKKIHAKFGFYIQQSLFDPDIINIHFLDENGENLDNNFIAEIFKKINTFDKFKIPLNEIKMIKFVDNEIIIKSFVEKISHLYIKKTGVTQNKITISNHNKGLTVVLSKLIGKLDFPYVINEEIKEKKLFNHSILDDKEIKKNYKDEIKFAQKNRSNILITFNSNGSNLLIFLIAKKQIIFINEILVSLIFLHNFFNDLLLEHKKISKLYIASNIEPIKSIRNLIRKYQIEFKIINEITFNENNYLLFYWNLYQQYIFGEKRNIDFNIYCITIKLLEIFNFYNLQNKNSNNLLINLKKMYDSFIEIKMITNLKVNQIDEKLTIIENSNIKKEYLKINSMKKIESAANIFEEKVLWKMELENETEIIFLFNKILDKNIILYRTKNENKKIWSDTMYRYKFLRIYKKIFKNN